MSPLKLLPFLLLPLLVACSDQRASFHIQTSDHALTLIREQRFFWDKTAEYTIAAARMPDCMRRHKIGSAPLDAKVEVYSPGNSAWILKQGNLMYVVETRTCEGFARLDAVPEGGMGPLAGIFQIRNDTLEFVAAPKAEAPPAPVAAPPASAPASQPVPPSVSQPVSPSVAPPPAQ